VIPWNFIYILLPLNFLKEFTGIYLFWRLSSGSANVIIYFGVDVLQRSRSNPG